MANTANDLVPFDGVRKVSDFWLDLFDGDGTLYCEITERWHEVMAKTIKCGTKYKRKLTCRLGVSRTEREDLEAVAKGQLGMKAIGSLEAAITGKTGVTTTLEHVAEFEEEFEFVAPECGAREIRIQQLQRLYEFQFEDRRVFRRSKWSKSYEVWIDRVHDSSRVTKHDPECGCKGTPDKEPDGSFIIDLGKISFRLGFDQRGDHLYLPDIKARVPRRALGRDNVQVRLKPEMLPPHLLFLVQQRAESVVSRFVPVNIGVAAFEEEEASVT